MIYKLARAIEADLQSREYPVAIEYGPPRFTPSNAAPSYEITVSRDDEAGDSVEPAPRATHRNPTSRAIRKLGCVARFYVSSPLDGARPEDHEHDCDDLVDAFVDALQEWAVKNSAGEIGFGESRYLSSEERTGAERSCGVVYVLRFEVMRGVARRNYGGAPRPTATIAKVTTTGVTANGEEIH